MIIFCKKNTQLIFTMPLLATALDDFQANPTLAEGDFKLSLDGGDFNNLGTLPTVTPAVSKQVKFIIAASELNGSYAALHCIDQTGPKEWKDAFVIFITSVAYFDDLVRATTPANTLDVNATGGVEVGALQDAVITAASVATDAFDADALAVDAIAEIVNAIWDELTTEGRIANSFGQLLKDYLNASVSAIKAKTDSLVFTGANKVDASLRDWLGSAPNVLQTGRVDSYIGVMGVDTLDANALKADAVTEIQSGLATSSALSTVQADTDNIQTRLPASLVSGRIDASIGAMASAVLTAAAIASNALAIAKFDLDTATYQAKVWFIDDNNGITDRYIVAWFKNGGLITAGITDPKIQVIKVADGTNLIAQTSMTVVGNAFRYNEIVNLIIDGVAYIVQVTATIDGSTRTWVQPIGRDS